MFKKLVVLSLFCFSLSAVENAPLSFSTPFFKEVIKGVATSTSIAALVAYALRHTEIISPETLKTITKYTAIRAGATLALGALFALNSQLKPAQVICFLCKYHSFSPYTFGFWGIDGWFVDLLVPEQV